MHVCPCVCVCVCVCVHHVCCYVCVHCVYWNFLAGRHVIVCHIILLAGLLMVMGSSVVWLPWFSPGAKRPQGGMNVTMCAVSSLW